MRRAALERAQLRKISTDGDVGAEAADRFRVVLSEGHDDLGLGVITIPVVVLAGLLGPLPMAGGTVVLSLGTPEKNCEMSWLGESGSGGPSGPTGAGARNAPSRRGRSPPARRVRRRNRPRPRRRVR